VERLDTAAVTGAIPVSPTNEKPRTVPRGFIIVRCGSWSSSTFPFDHGVLEEWPGEEKKRDPDDRSDH
jgi:hypothetical protein